jgi:hypothetical protein
VLGAGELLFKLLDLFRKGGDFLVFRFQRIFQGLRCFFRLGDLGFLCRKFRLQRFNFCFLRFELR